MLRMTAWLLELRDQVFLVFGMVGLSEAKSVGDGLAALRDLS
jgi:hypothetical protein